MYLKKLIVPTLCAFALIAISVGCKKSNNSTSSASTISASMGSTAFSVSTANTTAWYSTDSAAYLIGGFAVNGGDTTGLAMEIFTPFTLGTTITDKYSVNMDYYVSSTKDYFGGNGIGQIALTVTTQDTVNHKIAGTFTATLYNSLAQNDSLVVTNGKFNTTYSVQP
jgi:hypothetical protein